MPLDLEREQDIEELRRMAQALKAQNALLLEALAKRSREVEKLGGNLVDLQLTLKMIELLQAKAEAKAGEGGDRLTTTGRLPAHGRSGALRTSPARICAK